MDSLECLDGNTIEEMIQTIIQLAPHEKIAHHVPGRIRLKILPSGLKYIAGANVEGLLQAIPGVLDIRINTLARSIVVEYDQTRLPYDLWEALGEVGKRPELAAELADRLGEVWICGAGRERIPGADG